MVAAVHMGRHVPFDFAHFRERHARREQRPGEREQDDRAGEPAFFAVAVLHQVSQRIRMAPLQIDDVGRRTGREIRQRRPCGRGARVGRHLVVRRCDQGIAPVVSSLFMRRAFTLVWLVLKWTLVALGAYLLVGLYAQRSSLDYWRDIWRLLA